MTQHAWSLREIDLLRTRCHPILCGSPTLIAQQTAVHYNQTRLLRLGLRSLCSLLLLRTACALLSCYLTTRCQNIRASTLPRRQRHLPTSSGSFPNRQHVRHCSAMTTQSSCLIFSAARSRLYHIHAPMSISQSPVGPNTWSLSSICWTFLASVSLVTLYIVGKMCAIQALLKTQQSGRQGAGLQALTTQHH